MDGFSDRNCHAHFFHYRLTRLLIHIDLGAIYIHRITEDGFPGRIYMDQYTPCNSTISNHTSIYLIDLFNFKAPFAFPSKMQF